MSKQPDDEAAAYLSQWRLDADTSSLDRRMADVFDTATTGGHSAWRLWLAIVAVAAAVWIWFIAFHRQDAATTANPVAQASLPTAPTDLPPFRCMEVRAAAAESSVVLQDYMDMEITRMSPGMTRHDWTMTAIDAGNLQWRDAKGSVVTAPATPADPAWQSFLTSQTQAYATRIDRIAMTDGDWHALGRLALWGESGCVFVLQHAAETPGRQQAAAAAQWAGADSGVSHVRRLIANAGHGERSQRAVALRALAQLDSPMARQYLRTYLQQPADPLTPMVIDQLARDPQAIVSMRALVGNASLPETFRAHVQQALATEEK